MVTALAAAVLAVRPERPSVVAAEGQLVALWPSSWLHLLRQSPVLIARFPLRHQAPLQSVLFELLPGHRLVTSFANEALLYTSYTLLRVSCQRAPMPLVSPLE